MHPERRTVTYSIPVDNLSPHPLSVKIYGKPKPSEELLASIAEVGLLQHLIVNDYGDGSSELLSGSTRAEAWRILLEQGRVKTKWIPCRFVRLSPVEAERIVIESNRQRTKTAEMKAREFKELKRIETELAKERVIAAQNNKTGKAKAAKAAKEKLPEQVKGQARDKAAAAVGMSGRTAEKLEAVVDAADKGDTKAQEALAAVNLGDLSVSRAYKTVVAPKNPEKIDAGKAAAKELSKLFKNGEVTRSKRDGLFHVVIRDLDAEQVKKLAGLVETKDSVAA